MNFKGFIGMEILGFVLLMYAKPFVDMTQRFDFAEKLFGPGGTYTFVKLLGVGFIFYGFSILY